MEFLGFEPEFNKEEIEKEVLENKHKWMLSMTEPNKFHYLYISTSGIKVKITYEHLTGKTTLIKR